MSRKAMQQALDMLNEIADDVYYDEKLKEAITALEQALEAERDDLAKVGEVGVWGEVKPIYKIEGVGEYGLDLGRSPGVGPYYVRLYDGRYDASGFDTEQEAREELEYVAGLPRKNT